MSAAVIQVTSAAKVLAQLRARNMVKDHIRRRGEKLSAYKSAEITSWARLYVEDHPALQQQCLEESKEDDPSWAPWKTGAEGASCKTHNKCTKRGAANIDHFGRANLMLKIKNDRAIYSA